MLAAAFCGVAVAMNVGKVPIAMEQLRAEFGLSLVAAGWISSMVNLIGVTAALLFGLFGDRIGAQRMCFAGLAIGLLGGLGALFADGERALLLSRFAEGAGMVCVAVSAPALLSAASSPHDRRFALGIWSGYLPAGVGMVMLLAPLVMPLGGWRGLWLLTLGMLLLATAALWRSRPAYRVAAPAGRHPHPLAAAREALAQTEPWLLAAAMTCWTLQHYALIIWLPTYLREQRDLAAPLVALLSCLMVLANVPGNLIGCSRLPDLLRYGLCLLLSFIGGVVPASVLSSSASYARTPKQIGTLQGLYMQFGNIGPFIGPPLIAMLVAASGRWSDAMFVTGSAALAGIALGLIIRKREMAAAKA